MKGGQPARGAAGEQRAGKLEQKQSSAAREQAEDPKLCRADSDLWREPGESWELSDLLRPRGLWCIWRGELGEEAAGSLLRRPSLAYLGFPSKSWPVEGACLPQTFD